MKLLARTILLICIGLLVTTHSFPQDLVFTKQSSRIFSEETMRNTIQQYAYNVAVQNHVPPELFDMEYKKIETQLWAAIRPQVVKQFRYVETAGSVLTQEKRNAMYKSELFYAVRDAIQTSDAFQALTAFDQTDRILWFMNDIKVDREGWLTVTEYITIYNGSGQGGNDDIQRGLERTIPTEYIKPNGLRTSVPLEVLSVKKNNEPENFVVVEYGNGKLIRIGSADIKLADGVYQYIITYKTRQQLIFHEAKTELYWNVTGNGWIFTADQVSSRITFPSGSKIFENACYTGVQGSTARDCRSEIVNDSTIRFYTNKRLESWEGLTVAAAIQPGIISPPPTTEVAVGLLRDNWPVVMIAGVVLIVFIINLLNWFRVGRDPRKGTIFPQFDPPNGISSADAGFIYNQKHKPEQFSAALVELAVKRGINIQVEKKGILFKKNTYTFRRTTDSDSIKNFARSAFNWNLDELYDLTADGTYNSTLESLSQNLKTKLEQKLQSDSIGGSKSHGLFSLNTLAASWGFVAIIGAGIVGAIVLADIGTTTLVISAVGLLLFGLISQIVFYKIMPAYNKLGRKTLDDLLGFRMYLATAEEKRFDKLNPPEKNLELFERFLPYAIALDCQSEWANKFEDILKTAIANKTYHPSYYATDMSDGFSFSSLSNSFSSNLSSTISSSSTAPSSSSDGGSSGGGSSGGGGGGGGGGGW